MHVIVICRPTAIKLVKKKDHMIVRAGCKRRKRSSSNCGQTLSNCEFVSTDAQLTKFDYAGTIYEDCTRNRQNGFPTITRRITDRLTTNNQPGLRLR